MSREAHPTVETLKAFGLGTLDPPQAAEIEQHVVECQECCQTLLSLGDDTFVGLVRKSDGRQRAEETIDSLALPLERTGELPPALADHPRYRIVQLIGRGGMGDVYQAEHKLMNRPVAIKLISRQLVQSAAAVERFHREVQAAAKLSHANIVTAHDAEQAGDVHFLVMEYVEGTDLAEMVKQRGPLSVEQACDYVAQAARGLQHAHEQGMVHRDIKPHNLMLTADGKIKILDFGLANFASSSAAAELPAAAASDEADPAVSQLTTLGTMMGTPDFIAPEQADDAHAADIRADLYSLGCTLYFLLAGKPPFSEGDVMHKLAAHRSQAPEPIEDIRVDVPRELAEVMRRLLAKDPAERFQTPAEVADALAPFVDRQRSFPREAKPPAEPKRRTAGSFGVLALSIAAALFLAIGLGVVIYVLTDNGTIVIDSPTNEVQLVILEDGHEIRKIDVQKGETRFRFRSGTYTIDLRGNTSEFLLTKDNNLIIRRGRVVPIRIRSSGVDAVTNSTTVRRMEGHTEAIDAVAFTPDGGRIVTGGFDKTLRVWDAATGKLLDTIHTPHRVISLDVAPDGKTVVTGMFGTQVVLWDLETKRDLQHFIGHGQGNWRGGNAGKVLAVAFSPDGTQLASGGEGPAIRVWDVASGEQVAEFPSNGTPVQSIAWTSDGKRIVCGEYSGTMTWCNVETKQIQRRSDGKAFGKWLALSPDDRRTVATDGIRDAGSFALVRKLQNDENVQLVSPQFMRDGRLIVATSESGLIRVWDAVTGEVVARFQDAPGQANKLAISADGRSVAFGGGGLWSNEEQKLINTGDYALRIWRLPENVWPQSETGWTQLFNGKDLSGWKTHPDQPDGWTVEDGILMGRGVERSHLFSEQGDFGDFHLRVEAKINDTGNSGVFFRSEYGLSRLDGNYPAGYEAQILNGVQFLGGGKPETQRTGSLYALQPFTERLVPPNEWFTLEVIAKANHITITVNGQVTVDYVDVKQTYTKGHIALQLLSHTKPVLQKTVVQFRKIEVKQLQTSPVKEVPTAERLFTGPDSHGFSIAVSQDGSQALVGHYVRGVSLWDVASGKKIRSLEGPDKAVHSVHFWPDGKHAVAASEDGTIRLWELDSGKEVRRFEGHTGRIDCLALSPSGALLLSGSADYGQDRDQSLRLWDVASGKELRQLSEVGKYVRDLVFSHDNRRAYGACVGIPFVIEWDVDTGAAVHRFPSCPTPPIALAVSPSGRLLATGHFVRQRQDNKWNDPENAVVRLWDLETRTVVRELVGHAGPVGDIAFTPDGRYLLSAATAEHDTGTSYFESSDQTVRLWEVETGREVARYQMQERVIQFAVLPDGKSFLTVGDSLRLWRLPESTWPNQRQESAPIVELLKDLDPQQDVTAAPWERGGVDGFTFRKGKTKYSSLVPNVLVSGDYDLLVELTRTKGDQPAITFPVGNSACTLVLGRVQDQVGGLEVIDGRTVSMPGNPATFRSPLLDDKRYTISIQVRLRGNEAEVTCQYDGQPLAQWRGNPSTLSVYQHWRLPQADRIGLGAWCERGTITYHKAELRLPSRSAEPIADPPFGAAEAQQLQEACAERLGVPVEYTNSLGMKFRLIPPGEFEMGSVGEVLTQLQPQADWFFADWVSDRRRSEMPQRRVRITRPCYLGAHEVTVGNFRRFVEATGYRTKAERDADGTAGYVGGDWLLNAEYRWNNPGFPQGDDHPVCNIAWEDATAFCEWLGTQGDGECRLPTEAEWEYACRAGTTSLFSTGDDVDSLNGAANIADQSLSAAAPRVTWSVPWNDGYAHTAPVGKFRPNAFGLFDMHGNACEWCHDWLADYDPAVLVDPQGPTSGQQHVFRGGAFDNWAGFARSADRYSSHSPTLRTDWAGFRVVLSVESVRKGSASRQD